MFAFIGLAIRALCLPTSSHLCHCLAAHATSSAICLPAFCGRPRGSACTAATASPHHSARFITHTHSYLQHNSAPHFCWTRREQVSYVYAIPSDSARPRTLQPTVRKKSAIFHHFKPLCVVTHLGRSIYNSAVAEWTPCILFSVDRERAAAAIGNTR